MIREMLADGWTRDEIVAWYVEHMQVTKEEAEFIFAVEMGESNGDVVGLPPEMIA